jgi:hypothetical protein
LVSFWAGTKRRNKKEGDAGEKEKFRKKTKKMGREEEWEKERICAKI